MIKDLKEFRKNLYDIFTYEKNGKLILCDCGDERVPKEVYHKLYEECNIEELPEKFRESIKKHEDAGYIGMGSALVYGDYFFSNIHGESFHRCFKRCDKIPKFEVKLENFSFQYVKDFIEENNLIVRCPLRKYQLKGNCISGSLYVHLNYQKYFKKENSTGIEEVDEFFFWKGKNYKMLVLDYNYNCNKQYNVIGEEEINNIRKEIMLLFQNGDRSIFANEWEIL